jgi:hypothetical protein
LLLIGFLLLFPFPRVEHGAIVDNMHNNVNKRIMSGLLHISMLHVGLDGYLTMKDSLRPGPVIEFLLH